MDNEKVKVGDVYKVVNNNVSNRSVSYEAVTEIENDMVEIMVLKRQHSDDTWRFTSNQYDVGFYIIDGYTFTKIRETGKKLTRHELRKIAMLEEI